jgi:hypothetical protein
MRTMLCIRTYADNAVYAYICRQSCVSGHMRTMCIQIYEDNAVHPHTSGQCCASVHMRTICAWSPLTCWQFFFYIQTYAVFSLCIHKLWIVCPVYPDISSFVFRIRTDADNIFSLSLSGYLRTCPLFPDMYFVSGQLRTVCPVLPEKFSVCFVAGQLLIQNNTTNHVLKISANFVYWVCLHFNVSCYDLSTLTWFSLWCVYKMQNFYVMLLCLCN